MAAHDRLDGLGGFVGVVEWNGRDVMVQDVGFDDAVEQITANESKLAVNGGRRSAGKAPRLVSVMRSVCCRYVIATWGYSQSAYFLQKSMWQ